MQILFLPNVEASFLEATIVTVRAVDRCNVELNQGDILAVVGESGSGKTTLGQTIARIIDPTDGHVWFSGKEITGIQGQDLKALRREIQMVFQDPGFLLNPRHRIDDIIALPLKIHQDLARKEEGNEPKNSCTWSSCPPSSCPAIPTP